MKQPFLTLTAFALGMNVALAATPPPHGPKPAASAPATPAAPSNNARLDTGAYTVEGQNLTWNQRNGDFQIPSHVKFTQPGTDVTGNKAAGNSVQKKVIITGNVVLHNQKPLASVGVSAKNASNEPQTLTADELQIDGITKLYTAIGNVKFLQGSKTVTADRGQLNQNNHLLELNGRVHIDDSGGGQSMTADNVTYDTVNETVTATGKPFQIRSMITPEPVPVQTLAPPKKKR